MAKFFTFLVVIVVISLALFGYYHVHNGRSAALPVQSPPILSGITHDTSVDHIAIITMENKQYGDVIGSTNAPYTNSLVQKYILATNYFAVAHPSLPNYLAMIGGDTFGVTSDCQTCYTNAKNLVDQLEQHNKTWKGYMESMPSSCFAGDAGLYAQRHDPFIYFTDIRTNPNRCKQVEPYASLSQDLQQESTTPNFIFISPNVCHDTHDCSIETGDTWLAQEVPKILSSDAFANHHSLLFITYDEGEESDTNQVPMIVIDSTASTHREVKTNYTHYSLLKTIDDVWHMPYLTSNVSQSTSMLDLVNK